VVRYKRTALARWQAEEKRREARRERAWQLARQAAALLKNMYGVQRVVALPRSNSISWMWLAVRPNCWLSSRRKGCRCDCALSPVSQAIAG